MFGVTFEESSFQFLYHPRFEKEAQRVSSELGPKFPNHFGLFSSGTSSKLKGYVLSREALLTNARAVNDHFKLTASDTWGLSLPLYHVGGLSVLARAHLLGGKVTDLRGWNPTIWMKRLKENKISITTIVPTQLYDLVSERLTPPPCLRYLIVGGDFLATDLERKAMNLGWPVIRTYGMSEVSSQLASGKKPGDALEILPIHEVRIDHDQRLLVKSQSMFTVQFNLGDEIVVHYPTEFYPTEDRAELSGNRLKPLGRLDDQVKIGGHLINLLAVKEAMASYLLEHGLYGRAELSLEKDLRQGMKLVLSHLPLEEKHPLQLKEMLKPVSVEVRKVEHFDRTDLGKLKRI